MDTSISKTHNPEEEAEINEDFSGHENTQSIAADSFTQGIPAILSPYLNKGKVVEGFWVYQNDSLFNKRQVISQMEKGRAAKGIDFKPINLHHINQTMNGGIVELTQTFHQRNFSELHKNTGQSKSQIDRDIFASWRKKYWKQRSNDCK